MSKGNGSLFGYFLAIASGLTYAFYLVKMDKTGLVKMNALKLSFYLALFTTIEIFTINLFMQDVVFKMDACLCSIISARFILIFFSNRITTKRRSIIGKYKS